jgi:hypothetical protein
MSMISCGRNYPQCKGPKASTSLKKTDTVSWLSSTAVWGNRNISINPIGMGGHLENSPEAKLMSSQLQFERSDILN